MPLYPYICEDEHETEHWVIRATDAPSTLSCAACGKMAKRGVGLPTVRMSWNPPVIDSAKEFWDGTPLADSDGKNAALHKSKKLYFNP